MEMSSQHTTCAQCNLGNVGQARVRRATKMYFLHGNFPLYIQCIKTHPYCLALEANSLSLCSVVIFICQTGTNISWVDAKDVVYIS